MKHYLMFDLGTGNSRVALVAADGTILDIRSYANTYYRDDAYEDALYFLPEEWAKMLLAGCEELTAAHPEIRIDGISAAAARQSFVLIDEEGACFLGLPNIDSRGRGLLDEVPNKKEIYRVTGKWVTENFGAAKLVGLKAKYPEEYGKIRKITSLSEWVGYIFTGEAAMEYSQASESQFYDLTKKDWSEDLCDWYGVDYSILPPLVRAGETLGAISDEWKAKLNMAEDAVFIVGGADTQIAIRQTDIGVGDIAIVSGTTTPVVSLKDEFFYDPEERVWTEANLGGDTFQIEMNPAVTGMNYQRMKAQFCDEVSYEELEERYAKMTEVACTASFTTLLFYEQRMITQGGFFMRAPFEENVTRYELMYAVLADIACATYEQLRRLIDISGNDPEELLACGGGFQSGTLCRMLASLAGKPIRLKKGFAQATVQGLVNICNDTLGETVEAGEAEDEYTVFEPAEDDLIFKYYPIWLEDRNKVI